MSQRPMYWYRWEGVYSADFTLEGVQRRSRQLAETLKARQWSCLVAHDTRFLSAQFARYAYRVLEQSGARVAFSPTPVSLPMVELALGRRRFDGALLVTAGNRPYWYNGLHALVPQTDANPLEDGATPADEQPPAFPPDPFPAAEQTQIDVRTPYIDELRQMVDVDLIRRSTLTLFVDPMNGTTSGVLLTIIGESAQTRAIEINREHDPLFSRQTPIPQDVTTNRIRKLVKESDSHLGVAISADGRALGVTDNTGDLASPLEIALLLGQHLSRQHRLRGLVVVPRPADLPPGVTGWETATGQKIEFAADPSARIAEIIAQDRSALLVGMTTAGEPTIGRYSNTADATLAALLLTEMVAYAGSKLHAQLDELRTRLNQS